MENPFLHISRFKVRACEMNAQQKITFAALVQLFQEASLENIIQLKLSAWDDDRGNYAWVLIRKEIEVFEYPSMNEEVIVETFPSGFEKIFAYRDYKMYDLNKNLLAQASSTWTYMDLDTRKIAKIPAKFLSFDGSIENKVLPRAKTRIPPVEKVTHQTKIKIRKYHLDWNGHVNNNHYFKFIMEVLDPPGPYVQPKSVIVHIKNECFLGELLEIKADRESMPIVVAIAKEDGTAVVNATLNWST